MNIHIPNINFLTQNKKALFILTRPFWSESGWTNQSVEKSNWNVKEEYFYTEDIETADVYFIPKPINQYTQKELLNIDFICKDHKIKAYGYISGDFGENLGNYDNIVFFRMGGFKSQLGNNNKGFPVSLSDHFQNIYQKTEIEPSEKKEVPIIGFCGHADLGGWKRSKETIKMVKENARRFFKNPFRKDYEPFFASAYHRAKLLDFFEKSDKVITNFIYRKHYRAGAQTEAERTQTTLEYYDNIKNSEYVLCVRGAGNFSVRLYETLLMGRIPIFINTDCLLPFEDKINWKQHVVWIEWKDRKKSAKIVADFHQQLSQEDFTQMQLNNRKLWKETLSVKGMLEMISNDI